MFVASRIVLVQRSLGGPVPARLRNCAASTAGICLALMQIVARHGDPWLARGRRIACCSSSVENQSLAGLRVGDVIR